MKNDNNKNKPISERKRDEKWTLKTNDGQKRLKTENNLSIEEVTNISSVNNHRNTTQNQIIKDRLTNLFDQDSGDSSDIQPVSSDSICEITTTVRNSSEYSYDDPETDDWQNDPYQSDWYGMPFFDDYYDHMDEMRRLMEHLENQTFQRSNSIFFTNNNVRNRPPPIIIDSVFDNVTIDEENSYQNIEALANESIDNEIDHDCSNEQECIQYGDVDSDQTEIDTSIPSDADFEVLMSTPAIEQINAIRVPQLLHQKLEMLGVREVDDICNICLASVKKTYNLSCKHVFHRECLIRWLYKCNLCPCCRIPAVLGIFYGRRIE
ncbi:putative Zinc finger protein [Pseudoloma neurophilia]|uniref:Putative Zinc finger protein n=1 Tax=Pseudoloma neurophilia TaxID=146866 RepID=A0A0R0LSX2_9MICR|nr:putative Zinc finger protein [Pseudoloma neurophilia]